MEGKEGGTHSVYLMTTEQAINLSLCYLIQGERQLFDILQVPLTNFTHEVLICDQLKQIKY